MHVLIIPSWYPSQIVAQKGIFIKEQAEALVSEGIIQTANAAKRIVAVREYLVDGIRDIGFKGSITIIPNMVDVDALTAAMKQIYNEGPISVEVRTSLITLYSEILNPVESS